MVCTHVLIGLLLFSLFSSGVSVEEEDEDEVNLKYLAQIIQFFETKYKPAAEIEIVEGLQYAVAINVPANQCRSEIDQNFLSRDDAEQVKKDLKENYLYQGEQLVAATPTKGRRSQKIHSERALLMCEGEEAVTPVKNLLNKDKDGCVVFYTYNSPCLEFCLNQKRDDDDRKKETKQRERGKTNVQPTVEKCILNSLSILTNHTGPKAFVFGQVYRNDRKEAERDVLAAALKKVAETVPLYKCANNNCVKCLSDNQIVSDCLPEKEKTAITPSY